MIICFLLSKGTYSITTFMPHGMTFSVVLRLWKDDITDSEIQAQMLPEPKDEDLRRS